MEGWRIDKVKYAVLLDFGSTYTKVICVDMAEKEVIVSDKFPSTVAEDAAIALNQCFDAVKSKIGSNCFDEAIKLASSSAAGGLRIAVSGLSRTLSIRAGRNAGFGAGGKIVHTASGILNDDDMERISLSGAEIILLCGGYEGGNSAQVLMNAEKISEAGLAVPVIYAGNSHVSREVRALFNARGRECFTAENIIPNVGILNTASTEEIIRNLFMHRITDMNGVGKIKSVVNGNIIPTPAAVLRAGELLYRGTSSREGIGPFMMADIGGATTDIYSFVENHSYNGARIAGAPEPEAKRTVEGDMGMRESSITLLREVGTDVFSEDTGFDEETVLKAINRRVEDKKFVADNPGEKLMDFEIAKKAVGISARRHAGTISRELCGGNNLVQRGKNLTEIKKVIGTGGILVNNDERTASDILANVNIEEKERGRVLLPDGAETMVDRDYVFFAAGLLSEYDEEVALSVMKKSIGTDC